MSGRMQDVHLVEEDEDGTTAAPGAPRSTAPTDGPPTPTPGGAVAPGWLRRHARVLVPAALAVVVALVAGQTALDARERARLDALADVRGVLRPVGSDLGVRWAGEADDARVVESGAAVAGAVVGVAPRPGARVEVRALDESTGALRWSRELDLPTPAMTQDAGDPARWTVCTVVAPGPPPVVACLAQQPGGDVGPPPDVAVWFLDATDGTVLSTRRLPGNAAFTVLDGLFVVALRVEEQEDSARWVVRATDPATARIVWSYTTPRLPTPGRGGSGDAWSGAYASLDARGDRVLLAVGRSSWLLDGSGVLVRRDRLDPAWWPELARGGVVVHSTWSQDGEPQARVLLEDGARVVVDAAPLWLSVDDGTAPDVVFFSSRSVGDGDVVASVQARDAATGDLVWRVTGAEAASALVLEGRLYLAGPDGLFAVDASTGRVLWTVDLSRSVDDLATDGRALLVRGPGPVVEAYAPDDGRRLWRADLVTAGLEPGTDLRVGWQVPRLYALRTDGTVAVLG